MKLPALASLRARLAISFAGAVAAALVVFAAAVAVVMVLDERQEQADARARGQSAEEDYSDVWKALGAMAAAAPLAMGGAAALGFALAKRALAPVREAQQRVAAARASELNLTLPLRGTGDEWDALAGTLNALLADARGSMERIRRFTADAAHELRTPLTALVGEAELALRRERPPEEYRRALVVTLEEARRLTALTEALLTLARSDAGLLVPAPLEVRVDALAEAAAARARARHPERRFDVAAEPTSVRGDAVLLSRALDNLLDNAARHGGAHVRVSVGADAAGVRVGVEDDGPGVPAELAPRLFTRFARAGESRAGEGFGLGLAIVRAIAEAHGGTAAFVGNAPGAAFVVTLPRA